MTEPKRTKSGEHPVVVAYRKKLDSIEAHQVAELDKLNEEIEGQLHETQSIRPPPPPPPDDATRR